MAMNTPGEQRADERTGKQNVWMMLGIVALLTLAMIGVILYYNLVGSQPLS
jgi:hypothetical protein